MKTLYFLIGPKTQPCSLTTNEAEVLINCVKKPKPPGAFLGDQGLSAPHSWQRMVGAASEAGLLLGDIPSIYIRKALHPHDTLA